MSHLVNSNNIYSFWNKIIILRVMKLVTEIMCSKNIMREGNNCCGIVCFFLFRTTLVLIFVFTVTLNSVRSMEERRDRGVSSRHDDCNIFNKFIEDGRLVDLPICGRLFTWYRGDGFTMSRLDRYLLSENWCSTSPNCIQVANQRGLSDHVPFVLTVDNANWGPRPLRMLKCWADFPGYAQFVRDTWGSFNINGWGGFVLKEKLKLIKGSLK